MTAIENAAHLLKRELIDLRISALLSDGDAERESWCLGMARDTQSLAQRIAQWRKRNPSKQGRGKLYPAVASGPNPLEHCALIVSLLWHENLKYWPGQRNELAWQLCERIWIVAGGDKHGGVAACDGALSAWRKHMVAAKKYRPPHPAGKFIDRMLKGPAPKPPPRQRTKQELRQFYKHPRSRLMRRGDRKSRS
jgi:hypothetical protein